MYAMFYIPNEEKTLYNTGNKLTGNNSQYENLDTNPVEVLYVQN